MDLLHYRRSTVTVVPVRATSLCSEALFTASRLVASLLLPRFSSYEGQKLSLPPYERKEEPKSFMDMKGIAPRE